MKTQSLLSLCMLFMLTYQVNAQFTIKKTETPVCKSGQITQTSKNKIVYALCGSEVGAYSTIDYDVEERAYVRIPAKQWKGCQITNVEIGIAYEVGRDSYVFISKDLNGEPVLKQDFQCDTIPSCPADEDWLVGWKSIPLDKPYTIDSDDDLYIGWYTIQTGFGSIGTDWEAPVEGGNSASYRRSGMEEWKYQNLPHNVCVKVTIEGENLPQKHLRISSYAVDKLYYKKGENITLSGSVTNEGMLPITSFDLIYRLNNEAAVTKHIPEEINSLESYRFNYQLPINNEGRGTIILTAANPNGEPDDFPENASVTFSTFGCLTKNIQKNILVDELVGTDDEGAPVATQIIQDAIDKCERKENIIWIQNHALSNDEYTINGYSNYNRLFGDVIFTPAVNIDHQAGIPGTLMLTDANEKIPAITEMFIIDKDFGTHLNTCLDREDVYFSLGLDCEVVDDDVLKIKMSAKPAIEGLFPSMVKPHIALLITEDSIVGKQTGVEGEYIHNGVPRAFINDGDPDFAFIGDEVPFPADGFTLETKYILRDPTWKIENLKLIFYVMDGNLYIQNSVSCPIKKETPVGIKKIENKAQDITVNCRNHMLRIQGEFDQARIFSMDGQHMKTTSESVTNIATFTKGIYCVLIQKGTRFISEKFVIE